MPDVRDWEILIGARDQRSQAIQEGVSYMMMNLTAEQPIRYGERTEGINLVWDRNLSVANVKFAIWQSDKGFEIIREGDWIAIHVLNGGYLCYGERTKGINLVWSESPSHEWEFRHSDPPERRNPVQSAVGIGLYNKAAQDYVVYCKRPHGIDLQWAKDCK